MTPPKGRRGSLATWALKKTAPHWSAAAKRRCSSRLARPDGGGEAEWGVVGDGDGLVDIGEAEEHCDGAEELFTVDRRGAGKAGEDGGLVEVAAACDVLSTGEQARAGLECGFHLGVELVELRGGGERADLGVFACGVADLEGVHGGDEARFKFVGRWSRR